MRSYRVKTTRKVSYLFELDLGLNNYFENGSTPASKGKAYGLDPLGSRYVALRFLQRTRLGGEASKTAFTYGIEFAWNNYMFQKNVRIRDDSANNLSFKGPDQGIKTYDKSKFVVATVNIPLMIHHRIDKHFRFGYGVFGGYRLTSWDKVKFNLDGKTFRDHSDSNFNLNDFQYGVRAQVGFRGIDLFCNYHLSKLFAPGANPDVNAVSFGITL